MHSWLKPTLLTINTKTTVCPRLLPLCLQKRNFSSPGYDIEYENEDDRMHSYHYMTLCKNKRALSRQLVKTVIFNEDGLVILNKPYGVGSSATFPSLYDVIPDVAEQLGHKNLTVIKVPERYTSGITVLASDETKVEFIQKCIRRSKALPETYAQKYLAVTVGQPLTDQSSNRYGITKETKPNQQAKTVILRTWCNNQVKRREVAVGIIAHKVLEKNQLASLVSLSTFLVRHNTPRVFLSDVQLSPVLGDNMFGPRVSQLFGKKVLVNPWNAPNVYQLSKPLRNALTTQAGEEHLIPVHLHLHELRLRRYFKAEKSDLIVQAKPPKHFYWSCEKLGLTLPEIIKWKKEKYEPPHLQHDSS